MKQKRLFAISGLLILVAVVLVAVVLVAVVATVLGIFYWQPRILPGIIIDGTAVGGMRPEQAFEYLSENFRFDYADADAIALTYGNRIWQVRISDVAAVPDWDQAVQQAYAIGHSGSICAKATAWIRQLLGGNTRSFPLFWKADANQAAWRNISDVITEVVFTAAEDAFLDPRTGQICPEKAGCTADMEQTLAQVVDAIANGQSSVAIAVKKLPAAITTRDIARGNIRYMLATFTTEFSGSNANRIHNIALATRRINGTLLKPGQEFSFNQIVGPCTIAAGFKPAMEIVRQEYVPGVGGGVCQVVTTLYNAVLLAGLNSTERRPHSLLVGYVPPGRDATVYYDTIDFKFRNTTAANLMIAAQVHGNSLTISIIGGTKPKGVYSLSHRITTILQSKTEKTEYVEQKVEVWRDGPGGTRERISVDQYPAPDLAPAKNTPAVKNSPTVATEDDAVANDWLGE